MSPLAFCASALANPFNAVLCDRLRMMRLNECYLTAGCLFQTIWNERSGTAPDWGIKDYDIFYHDADVSWAAEDRIIGAVAAATADLPIRVEVRNQARVHLWYRDRFGRECPVLHSAREGIARYLITCTCVGINVQTGEVYAPYGLDELAAGLLRMNPVNAQPDLFQAKAQSYRARWPWLKIVG